MADGRDLQSLSLHSGAACVAVNNEADHNVFNLMTSASPAVSIRNISVNLNYYLHGNLEINPAKHFVLLCGLN